VRHSCARSRQPLLRNSFLQHSLQPLAPKMFVPRAVRLKGVKEPPRPKLSKLSAKFQTSNDDTNRKDDGLVEAMGDASMNSPAPQQDAVPDTAPTRGPRFTTKPVTPEYIAQLAAGIELIFTDYAHQEEERSRWLRTRYRAVDGEENCRTYDSDMLCLAANYE
jgi:hypothetical protein